MGKRERKKNKPKKKKSFLRVFLTGFVIFVVLLFLVQLGVSKLGGLRLFSGEEDLMAQMNPLVTLDSPYYELFQNSKRVNVLLLGINGHMTDTIMLGSYDMENQKVDVISVPRDTYYPREGVSGAAAMKINAIYGKNGAVGTAEAVSTVLSGIPIHYYVVIKYDGVANIVDSIGGVPVEIPFDMDYEDPYDDPPLSIHFKEGPTTLNGEDAVKYLRYRKDSKKGYGYAEGDVGRVKAQQEFVKSAFREALGFDLLKVAKTTLENVDSDLDVAMALKIAQKALGLEADAIETHVTPGEAETRNKASYWIVDSAAAGNMVEQIYTPPVPEEDLEAGN